MLLKYQDLFRKHLGAEKSFISKEESDIFHNFGKGPPFGPVKT